MNQPGNATDSGKCETCGALIPPDAPFDQCPACLLDFAGESGTAEPIQELPRRFGDYELLRQIGCGGMGLVYEATQIRLKRRVALKMVRPDLASRRFLRRFLVEGEAAARLDHPNIIPIYEIKEDGSESFLTMQFIEGETLKDAVRSGEFGFRQGIVKSGTNDLQRRQCAIARLMADVARAVHHAHERGVFHRDLKPGNIMLDAAGKPHIADFGVAKIVREQEQADAASTLTVPGAMLGTPEYMAPEQASGSGFDETAAISAADIYSLGAILYELLTGRPPFRGNSNLETLQKVREGDLKRPAAFNPDVARDLETICLKCLEKNPNARYASAAAVADELERWLAGKPITARPASIPSRVHRWVKRNPVGAALIVSLLFGVGVALGFVAVLVDRMQTAEVHKAFARQTLLKQIDDLWALGATNIPIPSSLLAEIREQKARPFVEGRDVRLKFGMTVAQDPITRAYSVAPFLGEIETKMSQELGSNVFIDLQLSKALRLESQLLSTGEADLQRLDPLSYLQEKVRDPGIVPLLIENDADEIVFCVSQESGITNLTQLAGKSIGFGDANSSVTIQAQHCLLTNGLRKSNLGQVKYFTSASHVSKANLPEFGAAEIVTDMREIKGGREALRSLLEGKVDAAVTLKRYFEVRRHRGAGLRIIGKVPGWPEVFAARSGLDPKVLEAFRNTMLSLENSPGLGTISSYRTVSGVLATDDRYFDGLRIALTNVQRNFEYRPQSPSDGVKTGQP